MNCTLTSCLVGSMNGKRWSDNKTWWIERKKAFTTIDNIKDGVDVINTEKQFPTISFLMLWILYA